MFQHEVSTRESTNVRVILLKKAIALLSFLAPPLAARLAARLFITPIQTRQPQRELAWANGSRKATIPSPLGAIPVRIWGERPDETPETVLLVHGWSGRGLQLGAFVEPLVKTGYRVVAHDAPAHGEASGRTASMPALAAALGAVARHFGPVSALIAHSLGSTATVYALANDQLDVERLVSISPAARLHAIRQRFGQITGFPPPIVARMKRLFEDRLGIDWEASEPLALAAGQHLPLLVIHDSKDLFIPHSEGAELADAWPDGRLMTTSGLGHHRILRSPEVISAAVSFINESAARHRIESPHLKRRAS
jgi:pimeloyl-ACP methyl ester carboxylesterase